MTDYRFGSTPVEKDKAKDLLMTQKHLTEIYNTASSEVDCGSLHTETLNILREEHELAHTLYTAMKKRGWYDAKNADANEVSKVFTEFNNMKQDVGM